MKSSLSWLNLFVTAFIILKGVTLGSVQSIQQNDHELYSTCLLEILLVALWQVQIPWQVNQPLCPEKECREPMNRLMNSGHIKQNLVPLMSFLVHSYTCIQAKSPIKVVLEGTNW